MMLQDKNVLKREGDWFTVRDVYLPDTGPACVTWVDEDGVRYIANIKVRVELDPYYKDCMWLKNEYIDKQRSMADIADQFGVSPMTINKWLNKHNIDTRPRGSKKKVE